MLFTVSESKSLRRNINERLRILRAIEVIQSLPYQIVDKAVNFNEVENLQKMVVTELGTIMRSQL